jgi:hypothetical protein
MLTITRKNGETIEFEPAFASQAEAANFLRHHRLERNEFVFSLLKQRAERGLSPKQANWLLFLATEHKAKLENKAPAAQKRNDDALALDGLAAVLKAAMGNGLKRPVLCLQSDAGEITLKAGRGSCFWITFNGELCGKLEQDGTAALWKLGSAIESVEKALMFAALQPLQAMQQFGRLTGRCSCCRRTLTDPVSVQLGIGPICKAKFGF